MAHSTGKEDLTRREREVLLLLARGKSNLRIAQEMMVTVRTVKFHTGNIYGKLGLSSRSEAIAWAWRQEDLNPFLKDQ